MHRESPQKSTRILYMQNLALNKPLNLIEGPILPFFCCKKIISGIQSWKDRVLNQLSPCFALFMTEKFETAQAKMLCCELQGNVENTFCKKWRA